MHDEAESLSNKNKKKTNFEIFGPPDLISNPSLVFLRQTVCLYVTGPLYRLLSSCSSVV